MSHPTLHEVAKAAGVSHTTVSWALRGDPRISADTTRRVVDAATRMGYAANEAARCLAKGCTATIAIVSPSFSNSFESHALRGIEAEMSAHHGDFFLVQYSTGGKPQRADEILTQILRGNRADAVICLDSVPCEAVCRGFQNAAKPLVLIRDDAEGLNAVVCDSRAGSRLAFELLGSMGARRVGLVTSRLVSPGNTACNPARTQEFLDLCAASPQGIHAELLDVDDLGFESGRRVASRVAAASLDSVFCAAGDLVAVGILAALREKGIRVPEDLRVVGYDNIELASMFSPSLTTIAQPLELMGREAVRSAFALLENPGLFPLVKRFQPSLIRRESA